MTDIVWRPTWPDDDLRHDDLEDYVAVHDGRIIGRIHNMPGHSYLEHKWRWFAQFIFKPNSGATASRREAMLALEETYERYLASAEGEFRR